MASILVIRPVAPQDLDSLLDLATLTGFGLTTLPRDRELLRKRIVKSQRSFADLADQPSGDGYLFVMEDLESGKIVGTSGIVSKVGGFEPFYAYQIETTVHQSTMLGVRKEIRVLHLVIEHNGPAEIGSLFLSPDWRHGGNGRVLSLSRFLFMAEHQACFDPMVIAEMRGVIDDQGRSAFWDAVGKHFFEIDFPKADYLSIVNKRFIADLMPKYPIYIPLLTAEAQRVIGQVHEQTKPALRLLESEGFAQSGMVDIFEAGPIVTCPLAQIRTVRRSRKAKLVGVASEAIESETHLIASVENEFRACAGPVRIISEGEVEIARECAAALRLEKGQAVRFVPLRSVEEPEVPHEQSLHPQHLDVV